MKLNVLQELSYFWNIILRDFSFFGSFLFYAVCLIFLLILKQTYFAQHLFVAIISVTALEILIKIFYKNRRPDFSAKQQTAYSRFEAGASFPSGHTGKITLFTTMLHGFYGNAPITALFIVIAVFVGISRIKLHRHYLSDVIGGYILGFIFGWLFS